MISTAWAQSADMTMGPAGIMGGFLPIAIVMVIFFFLILRPQEKKRKEHQNMTENLRRGDRVITAGGIHGVVSKVNEKTVMLEVAQGTEIEINTFSIVTLTDKGQPATKSKPATKKTPAKKAASKKPAAKKTKKSA